MLITAGPTYEPIDPVRFIGNYSSGKMGYALAEVCANEGAEVILVSGPVSLNIIHPKIHIIHVNTADQMFSVCMEYFSSCHAAILSAAVADFTPKISYTDKIKRDEDDIDLRMKPTKDIAAELGKLKTKDQILAGFALESKDELANAIAKLQRKNFDFIVLNSVRDEGAGFGVDTNKITIIDKYNIIDKFELKSKNKVAIDIIKKLTGMLV